MAVSRENAMQTPPRSAAALWIAVSTTAVLVAVESFVSQLGVPFAVSGLAAVLLLAFLVEADAWRAVLIGTFAGLAGAQLLAAAMLDEPVRVFAADLVAMPFIVAGMTRLLAARRPPNLALHFLALVAVGILLTGAGIALGNPVFDAVGTFRRICAYPVVYFAAAAAVSTRTADTRGFPRMAVMAGLTVSALAAYRLASGEGYAHEYFEKSSSVARFISYVESFAPILALLMLLSYYVSSSQKRLRNLGLVFLLLMSLVVSNYRAVWGALAVGVLVWGLVAGRRARQVAMPMVVLLAVAGIAAVGAIWVTNPEALPVEKISWENLRRTSSWRLGSWTRAIEVFLKTPSIGAGFGYRHRFTYQTGPNFDVWGVSEGHTVHNDLFWLLANGGVVLTSLVVSFHVRWWRRCRSALGRAPLATPEGRALAAILGTYAAVVAVSMLQPVFSTPATIFAVYLIMGLGASFAERLRQTRAPATPLETRRSGARVSSNEPAAISRTGAVSDGG